MTIDNYVKVAEVIVRWANPRAMTLIKQQVPVNTINEYLRNSGYLRSFINFFGIDLMKYNVVDELGFAIEPMLKRFGVPPLIEGLKKMAKDEDAVIPTVKDFVQSALSEVINRTDKKINVFGIKLKESDLQELKNALDEI